LGAASAYIGDSVTVTGSGFSAGADVTLYLNNAVTNDTSMGFGPTTAPPAPAGNLPAGSSFVVPNLAPGTYPVKVVDQYGAESNTVFFTVLATPVVMCNLRGTEYYPGDTLSWSIMSTDAILGALVQVTITDPSNMTWWADTWGTTMDGMYETVRFEWQLFGVDEPATLPADAPLGTWNWTIMFNTAILGMQRYTGLFSVVEEPTMQTVLDELAAMEARVTDVLSDTEGNIIAVVNTKAGQIVADINDLDAKITSIDAGMVTLSTAIGEVQTAVSNLDMGTLGADVTAIKGDVATIKTNLGTVQTSVTNLNAKVTDISDSCATVQTDLGTLQGTVTSIDGKVATIDTGVGSLQADVSDVAAKADQTPVWIAVVLSLVAAIAAIFAVITIRQKIAG
jgi:hypothetical protein